MIEFSVRMQAHDGQDGDGGYSVEISFPPHVSTVTQEEAVAAAVGVAQSILRFFPTEDKEVARKKIIEYISKERPIVFVKL